MKLPVPKFRVVRNTDDGCDVYECLACKATWECRSFCKNFCGNCGLKFEGEISWGNNPNYEKKMELRAQIYEKAHEKRKYRVKFLIEKRTFSEDKLIKDWHTITIVNDRFGQEMMPIQLAKLALGYLKTFREHAILLREAEPFWGEMLNEFRIRRTTEDCDKEIGYWHESVPDKWRLNELREQIEENKKKDNGD